MLVLGGQLAGQIHARVAQADPAQIVRLLKQLLDAVGEQVLADIEDGDRGDVLRGDEGW
ncbi:MAG: hypothetical protein ACLP50_10405 [Solirubrobacteraceae bacterium]